MKSVRMTAEAVVLTSILTLIAGCLGGTGGSGGTGEGEGGGGGERGNNTTTTGTTSNGVASSAVATNTVQLLSIAITPATSSVSACVMQNFVATGKYSDGTSKDISASSKWKIDPASSGVAIAADSGGSVMGVKPGSAVIQVLSGTIAASAVLNVVGTDTLNSIAITPASATLPLSGSQIYSANASCTNGSVDISRMNIWLSAMPTVATIGLIGVASAVAAGSTVISASAGNVAASAVLSVQ